MLDIARRIACQVYDQQEGEFGFEEVQGKMIIKSDMVDSGSLNVSENQQARVFEQTATSMVGTNSYRGVHNE